MKVSLGTVEMTDEQRNALAARIDGKETRRKATRDEARTFVWEHGRYWEQRLEHGFPEPTQPTHPIENEDDLIGVSLASELGDLL